jgi:hypothetical protein
MGTVYKVLAQSNPSANTSTTIYTVPSSTNTVVSTMTICNTTAANVSVNVAVQPAGGTLTSAMYVINGTNIVSHDTMFLTLGITLAQTDVVSVTSNASGVAFGLFGSEIS